MDTMDGNPVVFIPGKFQEQICSAWLVIPATPRPKPKMVPAASGTCWMGVSINGATPKAGCFKGKSIYKWMIIGGTPIYGNYHMLYMSLRPCKTHPTALLKLIQDIPRSTWKKTPWLQLLLELETLLGVRTNGRMTPCALPGSGAKDSTASRREAATVQRANSQLAGRTMEET